MMKLLNSLTFLTLLITLTSCLDELPELGNENYCPDIRLEDGTCPSAKSKSLGWDFSNASNYSFNSNYVEVSSGQASLKAIDTNFSGSDFSSGSHVGSSVLNNRLEMKTKLTDDETHVNTILPTQELNLISYWRFNNGLLEEISQSTGVAMNNVATTSNSSPAGKGVSEFDDSSNTAILTGVNRDLSNKSFSISAWVKRSSSNSFDIILSQGTAGVQNSALHFGYRNTNQFLFAFWGNDLSTPVTYTETDTWNHWVGTFDSTTKQRCIYRNGVEVHCAIASSNYIGTGNFCIGSGASDCSFSTFYHDGSIDELAVWNESLNSSEVFKLYEQQKINFTELSPDWAPHWDDIVGYWKMDGNWQDSSGNGNHGAASGTLGFDTSSKVGSSSGSFAGTDGLVSAATSTISSGEDKVTIAGWISINSYGNSAYGRVFSGGLMVYLNDNFDRICFQLQATGNNGEWCTLTNSLDQFVEKGFFYFTVTLDYSSTANDATWFLNGVQVDSDKTRVPSGSYNLPAIIYIGNSTSGNRAFDGKMDDLAIWKNILTYTDINLIYNRQKQKYAASYESPVIDLASTQDINQLSKTIDLPFMKELTTTSENSSDYSLLSGDLSNGLVGYWSLNESVSGSVGGADFEDKSLNNNHGNESGGVTFGNNGILSNSATLDGVNDYISITDSSSLNPTSEITLSSWVYSTEFDKGAWQEFIFKGRNRNRQYYLRPKIGSGLAQFILGSDLHYVESTQKLENGKWHHVVGTYDGNTMSIYIDGKLDKTKNIGPYSIPVTSDILALGRAGANSAEYFYGSIDEAAIWNRALSATEIQQLYRRGANRVKYQVRTCSDSTCSTDPEWKGPGADGTTYFSELYNRAAVDLDSMFSSCFSVVPDVCDNTEFNFLGSTLADNSSYNFSDFPLQNLNTRYFQYRVLMEAEENTACGGEPCLPSVSAITFETEHDYYASSPSITSSSPISITGRIRKAEHQISGGCTVKYQFSKDGTNFSYYNSGSWISATDNASQANTIDQISSTLKDYITSGSLYLRAYLASDGSQSCSLNSFKITHDD